jgi:hypothetical protein
VRSQQHHRLTKPRHPWTNGQVERMNRTIKDATVKRFYYEAHDELRVHLANFVTAYNFAKRLKTLKGLTPYEYICKVWTKEPERFSLNPLQQMPGLNTITSSSSVRPICAGSLPATPTITTNSERICPWKDSPAHRPIHRYGQIAAWPVLGGFHHQYCRI